MSYDAKQIAAELALNGKTFYAYPNVKAELTLMSTAVKADTTTHDRTIQSASDILQNPNSNYRGRRSSRLYQPGQGWQSACRDDGRGDGRRRRSDAVSRKKELRAEVIAARWGSSTRQWRKAPCHP